MPPADERSACQAVAVLLALVARQPHSRSRRARGIASASASVAPRLLPRHAAVRGARFPGNDLAERLTGGARQGRVADLQMGLHRATDVDVLLKLFASKVEIHLMSDERNAWIRLLPHCNSALKLVQFVLF